VAFDVYFVTVWTTELDAHVFRLWLPDHERYGEMGAVPGTFRASYYSVTLIDGKFASGQERQRASGCRHCLRS
jgi:hypothetical protein